MKCYVCRILNTCDLKLRGSAIMQKQLSHPRSTAYCVHLVAISETNMFQTRLEPLQDTIY